MKTIKDYHISYNLTNWFGTFYIDVFYKGKFYKRIELSEQEFSKSFDAMFQAVKQERKWKN